MQLFLLLSVYVLQQMLSTCFLFPPFRFIFTPLPSSLIWRFPFFSSLCNFVHYQASPCPLFPVVISPHPVRYISALCPLYLRTLSVERPSAPARHCTYNVTLRGVRLSIFAVERQKYYAFLVGVFILIHPAFKAYAPFIFSSMALLAPPNFSTLSHKRKDYRRKVIGQ